ncbi:glycine-rich cell wall structural protein-like isoform X4 [Amphibalanus amphitrite]|uniref:glycine-rich cell wall structural protein-like isoform X4 n=1 Tax=Amphibalanus amphitrite TaxID=1232801 RepID=UPI001C90F269|nr:glycine-rich cell wall structural protein-like isoform X4 [Amphibalanus amphitrite]
MIRVIVLSLCAMVATADGIPGGPLEGLQSHVSVQQYNPWGSSNYGVHQTHANKIGNQGGGYGGYGGYSTFTGGKAKVYAQAQGIGGHDGYGSGGYGRKGYGHGGYDAGHGGYGRYAYEYSADVGQDGYAGYGR